METLICVVFLMICVALGSGGRRKKALVKRQEQAMKFEAPNIAGSAKFSSDADARKGGLLTGKGIWLALSRFSGRVLRYAGDAHLLVVGPTGSGKARDLLIAIILSLGPKTLVAYDPKGQLLSVCYKARKRVGPVYALNPFGCHPELAKEVKFVRYNPMASLTAGDKLLGIRCDKIADGIVWRSGDAKGEFFDSGGGDLLSGLMMALVTTGKEEDKNLSRLCDVLCGDVYGYAAAVVAKTKNAYIRSRLGPYAVKGASEDRTLQSMVATARVHTQFIRNEVIGPSLAASDFSFKELRDRPSSLFTVLPPDAPPEVLEHYNRMISACFFAETLSEDCLGKTRILFVADEAGSLGHMKALLHAMSIARGYGLQILNVFTDIPQMARIYGEGYRSFIANSAVSIFFSAADTVTSREISDLSGQMTIVAHSRNAAFDRMSGEPQVSVGMSQTGVPLIRPEEVRDLDSSELLIFARGVKGVIKAKRKPYWKTHPGKFSPDPYEKGKRRK